MTKCFFLFERDEVFLLPLLSNWSLYFFINEVLAPFFLFWLVSLMGYHKVSHWWAFQPITTKTHGGLGFNLLLRF